MIQLFIIIMYIHNKLSNYPKEHFGKYHKSDDKWTFSEVYFDYLVKPGNCCQCWSEILDCGKHLSKKLKSDNEQI